MSESTYKAEVYWFAATVKRDVGTSIRNGTMRAASPALACAYVRHLAKDVWKTVVLRIDIMEMAEGEVLELLYSAAWHDDGSPQWARYYGANKHVTGGEVANPPACPIPATPISPVFFSPASIGTSMSIQIFPLYRSKD